MLKLFTTLTILLIAVAGFAQVQLFNTDSLIKKYSHPDFNKMRRIQNYQATQKYNESLQLASADTARYSATTTAGDIYNLPKSNMPCLKPFNVEANLSFMSKGRPFSDSPPVTNNRMPNVYKDETLVFEKPISNAPETVPDTIK